MGEVLLQLVWVAAHHGLRGRSACYDRNLRRVACAWSRSDDPPRRGLALLAGAWLVSPWLVVGALLAAIPAVVWVVRFTVP